MVQPDPYTVAIRVSRQGGQDAIQDGLPGRARRRNGGNVRADRGATDASPDRLRVDEVLTLANWTGTVEMELFAQNYKSCGLATVRYPVLEVTATVEPFENGRGFSLRVLRAGKARILNATTTNKSAFNDFNFETNCSSFSF